MDERISAKITRESVQQRCCWINWIFYFKEDTRELEKAKYRLDGPESQAWVMFLSSENSHLVLP